MVKVCLGDSKVVKASVWRPKFDGLNPRQIQTESKIQILLQQQINSGTDYTNLKCGRQVQL